ncbi:MAG: 5-formyltetrahydrofolate cyclo-ligase, partial [Actinomycetota bacterium]|nr:5-formyltetrahydrofolate cyclo-ligase [Actinomycetota bacterium]
LRGQIRARRNTRTPSERRDAGIAIAAGLMPVVRERQSASVACYFSLPTEPTTEPLIAQLWDSGVEVLTPRVRGNALEWIRSEPKSQYSDGSFGIREVSGGEPQPLAKVDLIFMPALAVSASGTRLGQGGGFYDRALSALELIPLLVAVLFADEDNIDVPGQAHDVAVDAVATDQGLRWITTGASSRSK